MDSLRICGRFAHNICMPPKPIPNWRGERQAQCETDSLLLNRPWDMRNVTRSPEACFFQIALRILYGFSTDRMGSFFKWSWRGRETLHSVIQPNLYGFSTDSLRICGDIDGFVLFSTDWGTGYLRMLIYIYIYISIWILHDT